VITDGYSEHVPDVGQNKNDCEFDHGSAFPSSKMIG
jgi:hypothetical protein